MARQGPMKVREASPAELADWDARTVDVPGGDVQQSRTWASYRSRHGWRPRFLVFDDGFMLLSLERPWRWVPGGGAYLSRGPVSAGEPAETTAERLRAAADWLAGHGIDVVSSDSEIPADTGYPDLLRAWGFHQIEEVQPSRHRVALSLGGADEEGLFRSFATSTRQRVRGAERRGYRIIRFDARPHDSSEKLFELAAHQELSAEALAPMLERFYDLLIATAQRRHFSLMRHPGMFVDWASHALADGLAVHLEVRAPDDRPLGAALFYRHGGRLTYANSADHTELRRDYPGVVHFLLWRAIQLAVRDGLREVDLGGVDVPGQRRKPLEGEEMYGLLAFKESFGGRWVEQAGNHEWVARPWRYLAGRLTGRLAGQRQALASRPGS
ncbi:MAG TPA: peptidoglycan bridge formation glycyltransferase FemA/FemB family protein [Candidatus Limnocylindrales bacterium]